MPLFPIHVREDIRPAADGGQSSDTAVCGTDCEEVVQNVKYERIVVVGMRLAAQTTIGKRLPVEDLQQLFAQQQVRLAICFGSYATGETHAKSDIDIAVELDRLEPGDKGYNDRFFEIYAAVSNLLGTDDVDLIDMHSVSGSLARAIFTNGTLIYGEPDRVEHLREQLVPSEDERPPRERLDAAIERMDQHLA
jgi:predicted nucleotidyltransferase